MNIRYRVELSEAERDELTVLLSGGKHAARKLKRAQILLAAAAGGRRRGDCLSRRRRRLDGVPHRATLEFHYTPKHASWLNMVEIEIGVLRSQCRDRRIGERKTLETEIEVWQCQRNGPSTRNQRLVIRRV